MSEGPTWIVADKAPPYPDGRFDGLTHSAFGYAHLAISVTPPLDPQQPTPEQIADAAREALADMQLVLRIWPYGPLSPLTGMKALVTLLTPPAPKWTALEDKDE